MAAVEHDWTEHLCAYGTAFGFATVVGGLALWMLQKCVRHPEDDRVLGKSFGLAPFVGHVERVLYTGALFAHQPIFIGLWLTLKTLGSGEVLARSGNRNQMRRLYSRFLVLSGASLAFSAVGWKMGEDLLDDGPWQDPALAGGGLVLGALLLWGSAYCWRRRALKAE